MEPPSSSLVDICTDDFKGNDDDGNNDGTKALTVQEGLFKNRVVRVAYCNRALFILCRIDGFM